MPPCGGNARPKASPVGCEERVEVALTLNALIELDRLEGVEPPQEVVDESRAAIANLKIRALPAAPVIG